MKITLITVGKIKEKYLRDAIAEYSKRLSRYCKLEILEVADEKTPDQVSEVVEKSIRDKEGERILKDALIGRTGREDRVSRHTGEKQYCLCDRRLDRAWGSGAEAVRLRAEFF